MAADVIPVAITFFHSSCYVAAATKAMTAAVRASVLANNSYPEDFLHISIPLEIPATAYCGRFTYMLLYIIKRRAVKKLIHTSSGKNKR